jgi:hypothetical protein
VLLLLHLLQALLRSRWQTQLNREIESQAKESDDQPSSAVDLRVSSRVSTASSTSSEIMPLDDVKESFGRERGSSQIGRERGSSQIGRERGTSRAQKLKASKQKAKQTRIDVSYK